MKLEDYCVKLKTEMAGRLRPEERVELAVKAISSAFGVKGDEVAFFLVDHEAQALRFAWPAKLKSAGAVPISAHNSLVAKTAREKRASLNNTFVSTPHSFIFEQVKIAPEGGSARIQKIMSAPLLAGSEVCGVVQVSRKGESTEAAGKDFSPAELDGLCRIAEVIAPLLAPAA